MRNLSNKKITALVLAAFFTTAQITWASIDTGLGQGIGGAEINNAHGGFVDVKTGDNWATVVVDGNTYINWETLNVNNGETLNFDGNRTDTVLNTVNQGMSKFYGNVNSNVGLLIISNPNGMLFDGAHFTSTGALLMTTSDLRASSDLLDNSFNYKNKKFPEPKTAIVIKDSSFTTGGDMTFSAKTMDILSSTFTAKNGNGNVRFTTTNGQDYEVSGCCGEKEEVKALTMNAVDVNGNLYILTDKGTAEILGGGTVTGDFNAEFGGKAVINANPNGKYLEVGGNMDVKAHGQELYLHNTKVTGNLKASNDSGFVEVGSIHVQGDVDLSTQNFDPIDNQKYNHFIHVIGNNTVGGNMNINSAQNIHIGGYVLDKDNPKTSNGDGTYYYNGTLADGSLVVGGNLTAKTEAGHITTTVDVTADNISYEANAGNYNGRLYGGNILTDGKAVLKANTYQFKADGYIGGLKQKDDNDTTVNNKIINVMESYYNIPVDTPSHDYLIVDGGTITKLETPGNAYISSNNDLTLTGANAGDINLVAPDKYIHITGPDVHANNINVGGRTKTVEVDFPSRDFTLNYTNIRDGVVTTVKGDEVITYELTNDPKTGYNTGKEQTSETTYLVGPGKTPEPGPGPEPEPTPDPVVPTDEAERNLMGRWVPEDAMQAPVDTPVAFAADLDEDEDGTPIRKNVDGSVTVVRAMTAQ